MTLWSFLESVAVFVTLVCGSLIFAILVVLANQAVVKWWRGRRYA